ncbi:MAG: isochorismatase family protein [Xanthomonadales bacterium]|nr:isochorismatase family protein [Xanthomonadales bacterium]NIN58380.1 isochorismatase family protein [Xanthomonadales bacterium]NIN73717.1 isochorismatase family protein [Xanthomonadales bacterium]NIO14512.1 isochorismatase family protein [Xanthomonadales bacterium]NIP10773.1 isochorismatase family protein [Xanthomonadales bacterium]
MDKFAEAGYGQQRIGFGERCAVLIVDLQQGFTDASNPLGRSPHVQRAVENTAILVAAAKHKGVPIASCRVAWQSADDMGFWKISTLYDGSFFHGHPCTELDPRISDPEYIFEFTKTAPSIFFRTPLPTWLTKHRIDTTIITGCTTSGCVRASIVDSFSFGYRTIVPEECCGDQDEQPHWDNLRDVGRRYADVVKLQDVLEHFEQLPARAA